MYSTLNSEMPTVNSSMCNISSTVVTTLHCNISLHNEKHSDRLRIQPRQSWVKNQYFGQLFCTDAFDFFIFL